MRKIRKKVKCEKKNKDLLIVLLIEKYLFFFVL